MDLVRLGLERSATAKEAVEVIISLLEKYGQGGSCARDKKFCYNNAYVLRLFNKKKKSLVLILCSDSLL